MYVNKIFRNLLTPVKCVKIVIVKDLRLMFVLILRRVVCKVYTYSLVSHFRYTSSCC